MRAVDFLTGLHNMAYLRDNYAKYIKRNKQSKIIAIDFSKLKHLNDNFGHAAGDECLKLFAHIATNLFKNSLLIRRSGDEFVFVTSYNNRKIQSTLEKFNQEIEKKYQKGYIPVVFTFNCGIKNAENNLDESLLKADITMYTAKEKGIQYEYYNDSIYNEVTHSNKYINRIDELYKDTSKINFVYQPIYELNNNKIKMYEIYSRDDNNETIFEDRDYRILKLYHRFKIVDMGNIEEFFKSYYSNFIDKQIIINIHYQTLFYQNAEFLDFIKETIKKYHVPDYKLTLSINIHNYHHEVDDLKDCIKQLKKDKINICLDNYNLKDSSIINKLIAEGYINYIKISKQCLRESVKNTNLCEILMANIKLFKKLNIQPIFSNIDKNVDVDFIKTFESDCLIKGYSFSKEIKVEKI